MSEVNTNESVDAIEVNSTEVIETPTTSTMSTLHSDSPSANKGYRNKTAKLLNSVFVVSLVLMIAFLLFQAGFSMFSYSQQGAPLGISVMYTLISLSMPITLCFLPFLFKFFAEVVQLLDRKHS